jgi:hypothetical protein
LEAGKPHKIRLEYFENTGTATARFRIASATQPIAESAKAPVAKADVVVVCVGFEPATETEGSDRTFRLPGGQDTLIEQIANLNKDVIVVVTSGGGVDMTRWIDKVPVHGEGISSRHHRISREAISLLESVKMWSRSMGLPGKSPVRRAHRHLVFLRAKAERSQNIVVQIRHSELRWCCAYPRYLLLLPADARPKSVQGHRILIKVI